MKQVLALAVQGAFFSSWRWSRDGVPDVLFMKFDERGVRYVSRDGYDDEADES